MELKHSFAPLVDPRTRLLVLGSLPGEQSLAEARYYANPRNQFWRLMSAVVERDLVALDYEERLGALRSRAIGLWDVIGSASRSGSLDTAIKDHVPNDLLGLTRSLPRLRALAYNGGTAARIGRKQLGDAPLVQIALPSSSPAFTLPIDKKREQWLQLRRFLLD